MEKIETWRVMEAEMLACCGSTLFAKEMVKSSPFNSLHHAISSARDIWFNKVDVKGFLEAFEAHPQIGQANKFSSLGSPSSIKATCWSQSEQSTALATATSSTLEELAECNAQYRKKFGFIYITCAAGRSSADMLSELKKRLLNKPIKELEIAAEEQMKITEIRLEKLFLSRLNACQPANRVSVIAAHITESSAQSRARTRPPITTHVLDVSQGKPAAGVEVLLEIWKGAEKRPSLSNSGDGWEAKGSSFTDVDGRCGKLLEVVDLVDAGIYRISFNTGSYCPKGFFPYVSVVFEITEQQREEHFHVPLLLSPFSFTTYRGS